MITRITREFIEDLDGTYYVVRAWWNGDKVVKAKVIANKLEKWKAVCIVTEPQLF